jgi:hypothetical protein
MSANQPHQENWFEKNIEPLVIAEAPLIISSVLADPLKREKYRHALRDARDILNAANLDSAPQGGSPAPQS